ncbi:hypothetical protein HDU67_007935 [Dinochytrium kinnereticum]|nr:hypothetical protein HDU67_007935 [Dinochytrium kinnereticum]
MGFQGVHVPLSITTVGPLDQVKDVQDVGLMTIAKGMSWTDIEEEVCCWNFLLTSPRDLDEMAKLTATLGYEMQVTQSLPLHATLREIYITNLSNGRQERLWKVAVHEAREDGEIAEAVITSLVEWVLGGSRKGKEVLGVEIVVEEVEGVRHEMRRIVGRMSGDENTEATPGPSVGLEEGENENDDEASSSDFTNAIPTPALLTLLYNLSNNDDATSLQPFFSSCGGHHTHLTKNEETHYQGLDLAEAKPFPDVSGGRFLPEGDGVHLEVLGGLAGKWVFEEGIAPPLACF